MPRQLALTLVGGNVCLGLFQDVLVKVKLLFNTSAGGPATKP